MFDDQYLQETLRQAFEISEHYNVPYGISRFDYGNNHGWWVRVTRDKARFSKLFSDGKYGSISEALKKAILYRHEILKSFPVTIKQIHARALPKEPELRIKKHVEKGRKNPYVYWRARWYNENHEIESENFSVRKYGEEEAKILAYNAAKTRHNKKPKLSKIPDPYKEQSFRPISRADVEVLASINSTPTSSSTSQKNDIISNNPFAFEGERKLELHKSIERNRNLRNKKVSVFLEEHGKIFCELCRFNFRDRYPFLETDIIEVHHIVPLATLTQKQEVRLADLMLLCSNCHFAIHQGDVEENLLVAMDFFESIQEEKKS